MNDGRFSAPLECYDGYEDAIKKIAGPLYGLNEERSQYDGSTDALPVSNCMISFVEGHDPENPEPRQSRSIRVSSSVYPSNGHDNSAVELANRQFDRTVADPQQRPAVGKEVALGDEAFSWNTTDQQEKQPVRAIGLVDVRIGNMIIRVSVSGSKIYPDGTMIQALPTTMEADAEILARAVVASVEGAAPPPTS